MVSANDGSTGFWAILPPWMRKVLSGNLKFWAMTEDEIEFYLEGRRETIRLAQHRQDQVEEERNAMYGKTTTVGKDDVEARASTSSNNDDKHSSSHAYTPSTRPNELPHSQDPEYAGVGIGLEEPAIQQKHA